MLRTGGDDTVELNSGFDSDVLLAGEGADFTKLARRFELRLIIGTELAREREMLLLSPPLN